MSADKSEAANPPGKRSVVANVVLAAVWLYVAMIFLLALDQQFHWGIF
jgi:hypothetical protein